MTPIGVFSGFSAPPSGRGRRELRRLFHPFIYSSTRVDSNAAELRFKSNRFKSNRPASAK